LGDSAAPARHGNFYDRVWPDRQDAIPYPILVFAAMLPWQFFSNALSEASNSLIGNTNLLSKVYFPRLIIPAGTVIRMPSGMPLCRVQTTGRPMACALQS
jgi:hypothetical protein